jgi:Tfp pilus assembly protein PilF
MTMHKIRFTAVILLNAMVIVGCQLADFRGKRDSARGESLGDAERLSSNQISDVKVSLARSLEQQGKSDRALETYQEVLQKNPEQPIALWRLAVLQDRKGEFQESEPLYRRAIKIAPKNPDLHCDFGYSLYLQRRWGEAEDQLREAIALKPHHRRAHNNLGLLLASTERTDDALAEFKKSGCDLAQARSNLAFMLMLNHHWDDAREQYELALEANPDLEAAQSGLENLNEVVAKSVANSKRVALVGHEQ